MSEKWPSFWPLHVSLNGMKGKKGVDQHFSRVLKAQDQLGLTTGDKSNLYRLVTITYFIQKSNLTYYFKGKLIQYELNKPENDFQC